MECGEINPAMDETASANNNAHAEPTSHELNAPQHRPTAMEALKMKEEQIRVLMEQSNQLIRSLDRVECELEACKQDKVTLDKEHEALKGRHLDMVSKVRAMEGQMERMKEEYSSKDVQLTAMAERNERLLRLLEAEESNNARLASDCEGFRAEVEAYQGKFGDLVNTGKSHEELANKALKEGELRAEELRILRTETGLLRSQNQELKIKVTVELEALQEQLRLRKEKQYQLMEKLQTEEEARRQAEDHVTTMKETIREIQTKNAELETHLQLEISAKLSQEDAHRKLRTELRAISDENKDLTSKWNKSEQDRLHIEAEARESGEKLREMAEKVFQLLEKLKLSDLGKDRALDALRTKEQEILALKKKIANLAKQIADEEKTRVQAERDHKVLEEQVQTLKKHNSQLGQRCKEEAKQRLQEEEQRKTIEDKARTMDSRLSFLLNKLQSDEGNKVVQREEIKKIESQLHLLAEKYEAEQFKANTAEGANREFSKQLLEKDEEIQALKIKFDALKLVVDEQEKQLNRKLDAPIDYTKGKDDPTRNFAGGRLRFFVDSKSVSGSVTIKGKCQTDRDWIERHGCNHHLRKAMRNSNFKEALLKYIAELCGLLMAQEEEFHSLQTEMQEQRLKMDQVEQRSDFLEAKLCSEEESKRRTLVRYVTAVKASVSLGEPGSEKERNEVGRVGAGRIYLPELNLSDEEVHAITATIRDNATIAELNLRGNHITDDGARAIAALLAGRTGLQNIDLRGNRISQSGIRAIAEALESSQRVKQVCVHEGGKIEAFGAMRESEASDKVASMQTGKDVYAHCDTGRAICTVDIRENRPQSPNKRSVEIIAGKFSDMRPSPVRQAHNDGGAFLEKVGMIQSMTADASDFSALDPETPRQDSAGSKNCLPPIWPTSADGNVSNPGNPSAQILVARTPTTDPSGGRSWA